MDYEIIGRGTVTLRWQPHIPNFRAELLVLAEDLWKKRPKSVFNGSLFMHVATQPTLNGQVELLGVFTDYRFYYTQKKTKTDFDLRPIAVSGVIVAQDQVIIGKRGPDVTSYVGWWEFVPSGTLDLSVARDDSTVDYVHKITEEFTEETKLPPYHIMSVNSLGVVYDHQDQVYDVLCILQIDTSPEQVIAAMQKSPEYTEAIAVPRKDLAAWIEANQAQLIPTSHALFSLWNK